LTNRPYVLLSAAMSVDGYLDDTSAERLLLSDAADFDRVDELRAQSDAILVGAETIRRDNPRLRVRDVDRRAARVARGLPVQPLRVTVTAKGGLDPSARFFTLDDGPAPVVYGASGARRAGSGQFVDAGEPLDLARVLADLADRGVGRLLVEGGGQVHTQFLAGGFADELHLAVAPLFVGAAGSARFVGPAVFPHGPGNRMRLAGVEAVGDMAVLRYLLRGLGGPGRD
jgi:5-amino-6-(5-phosphoribosylamino)uracil reductase